MATKTLWKVLLTGGAGEAFRIDDASGDTKVYIDGNEITELSGVTATAAELNILDGCTATTAELNYNDIATLGTGAASKAVVLDGSGNYTFPGSGTFTVPSGYTMTFDSGSTLTMNGTFSQSTLNLTGNSNQIVLDSDDGSGFTTTITDSATAARVLTLPDATDTIVGKATTDTFTNKTFDANATGNSISNVDLSADVIGTTPVANGGTGTTTLTDGGVLLGSGTGAITAMSVLADGEMIVGDGTTDPVAESGATLRTSIGVGTGDSPQFTGIELGHATDTTLARVSAGVISVEGVNVVTTSSTDTLTNKTFDANGTGNSLSNVDVADLAVGTDGELITWDSAGNPTTVAVGTSGHVLTSNGAGAAPTFQAGGGGGLSNVVEDTTPQLGGQLDVNGNAIGDGTLELITFTEDASAVNHINIENEATGSGPIISAAGDDANVDLNLVAKGTGDVKVGVYTFDGDQSVGAGQDNYVLTYDNGSGLVSLEAASGGTAATQAELETGSSTTVFTSPGRQQFHDSACKVWANLDGTGTATLQESYNMTSITDNGTGDYTFTIATDFSTATWAYSTGLERDSAGTSNRGAVVVNGGQAAGSIRIKVADTPSATDVEVDVPTLCFVGFGDHA